jgi:glycerophosphoryl diester phosphodiesterase
VEIDAGELTPAVVDQFHSLGIKVEARSLGNWDRVEYWAKEIEAGVDWIQTDLPEDVLAWNFHRLVPKPPVLVSCHRGANRYCPENTLPAFAKAGSLGVDYIEFDVRATRDGKYFLLHDGRLNRTTDGSGPIVDSTSDQVSKLYAGGWFGLPYATAPVPTLDAFLASIPPRMQLYFDAKAIPAQVLSDAIEQYHFAERTIVYQSAEFLLQLKAINPKIRALSPLRKLEDIDVLAAKLQPYAVDAEWELLSKNMIDHCHSRGIKVFSDALGPNEIVEKYRQAIDWGIDLIQTDHPLRVFRAMEALR